MPAVSERVRDLHARLTPDAKLAQIVGFWVGKSDANVAPLQSVMDTRGSYEVATEHGLGHLTRVYGTRPVDPIERASWLWDEQRELRRRSGHGIGAIVHEECLTGLAAWGAATFPTPLAWGASFDPEAVEQAARLIGESMHTLGIHQGLAPVLDVIRDPRWGRVDECIGEDPYLVGTIGTAFVRGLQAEGVHATLKHFVGYSASQGGRNQAPVHVGGRQLADVLLPPFEMAVRDGGARSVMNAYVEIDGVPVAATPEYLTGVLREQWGFTGVVVADYFSVAFLHLLHGVAADLGQAAIQALTAGIDVELPTGDAYTGPLREYLDAHPEEWWAVDRAVLRVLAQKEELGLLDEPVDEAPTAIDLDSPAHRAAARTLAEESVILLTNDGTLPIDPAARKAPRIAVIGPNAERVEALMGCYSFVNHVLPAHPEADRRLEVPTVLAAIRDEFPRSPIEYCDALDSVESLDTSNFADAERIAARADVAIVVVGDLAGLFGRGTVGEGNDTNALDLPGVQRDLVERLCATGTPVVMVLLTGRPYAIEWALEGELRPAAILQAFFPGEEGGPAIARILSGAVNPSGRLPLTMPRAGLAQPYSYLHPMLGGNTEVTVTDSAPALPFGYGLSYTTFEYSDLTAPARAQAGSPLEVSVTVTNTGDREGTDVVQLYAHDTIGSVTRPIAQLVGYARVHLAPGAGARVTFDVPPTRLAFTGRDYRRIVEPGDLHWWVGASCLAKQIEAATELTGETYLIGADDGRIVTVRVTAHLGATVR